MTSQRARRFLSCALLRHIVDLAVYSRLFCLEPFIQMPIHTRIHAAEERRSFPPAGARGCRQQRRPLNPRTPDFRRPTAGGGGSSFDSRAHRPVINHPCAPLPTRLASKGVHGQGPTRAPCDAVPAVRTSDKTKPPISSKRLSRYPRDMHSLFCRPNTPKDEAQTQEKEKTKRHCHAKVVMPNAHRYKSPPPLMPK